jgi:hypothetical protein
LRRNRFLAYGASCLKALVNVRHLRKKQRKRLRNMRAERAAQQELHVKIVDPTSPITVAADTGKSASDPKKA